MSLTLKGVVDSVVDVVVERPKRAMKRATRQVLLWMFPDPKKVLEKWTMELLSQGKTAHKIAFGLSWWAVKKLITRNGPVDLYEHTLTDAAWFFRVGENGFHIYIEPNLDSPKEPTTLEFETIEDFARLIQETTGTDPLVFLAEMIESWKTTLAEPDLGEEPELITNKE